MDPEDEEIEALPDGPPDGDVALIVVDSEGHQARLDRYLAQRMSGLSRNYLQQRIAAGDVQVDGRVVTKPSLSLTIGQQLQLAIRPTLASQAFVAQPMPLNLVFEDEDLLVVDKPAGLVVHPAAGNWSGTLLNGLLARDPCFAELPRAGIVHRLDKDTSGLMVVAKSRQAMGHLVDAISSRSVGREYLACVQGRWQHQETLDVFASIGRDPRQRVRMKAFDPATPTMGRKAWTRFELMSRTESHSLLYCRLGTGRTHQIRAHAQWLGHPLLGDVLYGGRAELGMTRQALHAASLQLEHPSTKRPMHWISQPPPDLLSALQAAGLGYNPAQVRQRAATQWRATNPPDQPFAA